MTVPIDLRDLAGRRPVAEIPRPRHLVVRYVLPGLVLLGFVGVITWAARDSLLPSRPVTVVPVVTTRAEVQQEGAALFQSAGWVEPRPTPIVVTALAEGVVEQLLAVEGQEVKAGDVLARLIDADAKLALAGADVDLRQREAEAEALIAKVETDLLFLPYQLKTAEAQERLCRIDLESKKNAPGALPAIALHRAESDLATASFKVMELKVRKQRLECEAVSLKRMRQTPGWAPETSQGLTDAEAGMKAALTRIGQAQVAVDTARLRLNRMVIQAPVTGRVLALHTQPGAKLMGLAPNAMHDSSTVLTLYDPQSLQIRADVRFEDLPNVRPGMSVRIDSAAVPGGALAGVVLRPTSQADIQKNTLQVKVQISEPPSVLKPDMLVQVTFLASRLEGKAATSETLHLLVPRQLVDGGESGGRVWVADLTGRVARARSVKLGRGGSGELVEVVEGLTPADKLIVAGREGLTDGARISVQGEDTTLGTGALQVVPSAKHH